MQPKKPVLLASAPNEKALKVAISSFWVAVPEQIVFDGETVILRGVPKTGVRVVRKNARWRFEML